MPKLRLEEKRKAIALRKRGFTYSEIRQRIPNLSKGTLSGWLRYLDLTPEEEEILRGRMSQGRDRGRYQSIITRRKRRIEKTQRITREAKAELPELIREPLFLAGLSLYWAEGAKRSNFVSFINSDPPMIRLMIKWFSKYCGVPKGRMRVRLYIHRNYAHENLETFWSDYIGISQKKFLHTIYKPTSHRIKKRPQYRGCLRVDAGGVDVLRRINGWTEGLLKELRVPLI